MGGVISLSPVVEGLKRVEKGVDKTASELAIARLNKEIAEIEHRRFELSNSRQGWQLGSAGCGTFIVIAMIAGIFSNRAQDIGTLLLGFGIGFILIFAAVKIFGESSEEKQLQELWMEKRSELTRHQQIVHS